MHPVCSRPEPVHDLLVVQGEEDDTDQTHDKRDVVPCTGRTFVSSDPDESVDGDAQAHSLRIQYLHFIIASQSNTPFLASSFVSLGVGLGVLVTGLTSTATRPFPLRLPNAPSLDLPSLSRSLYDSLESETALLSLSYGELGGYGYVEGAWWFTWCTFAAGS